MAVPHLAHWIFKESPSLVHEPIAACRAGAREPGCGGGMPSLKSYCKRFACGGYDPSPAMRQLLVPVLVVLVFPALYLSSRLGRPRRRALRWLGAAALVAIVASALPYEGVELPYLKRIDLFLSAAVAAVLLASHFRLGGLERPAKLRGTLLVLAAFAVTTYFNFFSFHGERTFVQLHDVAHYYLGAKYYAEAGYSDLYVAMLRAESELYDDHFKSLTARDLETYDLVHVATLLRRSHEVKAGFTEERWADFKKDVAYFRERLDQQQYATLLTDHGFNATPVWTLFGATLARRVPAGSGRGILALSLIDGVLVAAAFAAVGWAFGARTALVSVLLYTLVFGANFAWTGGAFLRHLWFFSLVAGITCLRRRRHAAAGVLLALSTLVRIFPVFFVLPIFMKGVALAWRHKRWPRREAACLGSFAAAALVLVAATGLLPRGFHHWSEFRRQMDLHVANISPNVVGLTDALSYQRGRDEKVTQEEFNALKQRRRRIYTGQLLLIFAPVLVAAWRLARVTPAMGTVALGLPLLHSGLGLASYYQIFLVVLVIWRRNSAPDLALVFLVETASYSLALFEDREGILFIYRSLLLLFLYGAVFLPSILRLSSTGSNYRSRIRPQK